MATTDSTGLRRSNRRVTPELIVDLTGCSFLDSRGLGALNATSNPDLFEIHPSLAAAVNDG